MIAIHNNLFLWNWNSWTFLSLLLLTFFLGALFEIAAFCNDIPGPGYCHICKFTCTPFFFCMTAIYISTAHSVLLLLFFFLFYFIFLLDLTTA